MAGPKPPAAGRRQPEAVARPNPFKWLGGLVDKTLAAFAAKLQPAEEVLPDPKQPAGWRCAPWNRGRKNHVHFAPIVFLIVLINYLSAVVFPLTKGLVVPHGVPARAWDIQLGLLIVFHVPLVLMIASWIATCITDPGTAEVEWWQSYMQKQPSATFDSKSGLFKPPRSHFDSVTRRLTLNMDHFCPWVVNTIGFYNKKFFVLFLFYVNISLLIAIYLLGCILNQLLFQGDAEPYLFWIGALLGVATFDTLLESMLLPFFIWHVIMVMRNETTIESSSARKYNVGCCQNLRQVFGNNPWTWWLPCYFSGPEGDGLRWPTRDKAVPAMV